MRAMRCAAAALCAAVAACSGTDGGKTQQGLQNAAVATAVHAKLATIDADSLTAVKVQARDGVVTLGGKVHSARERDALDSAAATVDGVTRVVDRLTVDPKLRGPRENVADAALAAKVRANIAAQAGINAAKIGLDARDGVVTLSGTVSSPSLKATIANTARKTAGVKNVVDRIEVKS